MGEVGGGGEKFVWTLPLWFPGHPILACGLLEQCFSWFFFSLLFACQGLVHREITSTRTKLVSLY